MKRYFFPLKDDYLVYKKRKDIMPLNKISTVPRVKVIRGVLTREEALDMCQDVGDTRKWKFAHLSRLEDSLSFANVVEMKRSFEM